MEMITLVIMVDINPSESSNQLNRDSLIRTHSVRNTGLNFQQSEMFHSLYIYNLMGNTLSQQFALCVVFWWEELIKINVKFSDL